MLFVLRIIICAFEKYMNQVHEIPAILNPHVYFESK